MFADKLGCYHHDRKHGTNQLAIHEPTGMKRTRVNKHMSTTNVASWPAIKQLIHKTTKRQTQTPNWATNRPVKMPPANEPTDVKPCRATMNPSTQPNNRHAKHHEQTSNTETNKRCDQNIMCTDRFRELTRLKQRQRRQTTTHRWNVARQNARLKRWNWIAKWKATCLFTTQCRKPKPRRRNPDDRIQTPVSMAHACTRRCLQSSKTAWRAVRSKRPSVYCNGVCVNRSYPQRCPTALPNNGKQYRKLQNKTKTPRGQPHHP